MSMLPATGGLASRSKLIEKMGEVFIGQIIHSKSLNDFELLTNGFVAIENGKIIGVGPDYNVWKIKSNKNLKERILGPSQFLMPGLIDCHIHAPQMPQIGLGLDKPLLEWLETYTFPLEAQYNDSTFAQSVYEHAVRSTIKCGTTLASYFATNHKESSVLLAKEAIKQGQRAFIGKVCSDSNCPDFYIETCEDSLKATADFVNEISKLKSELVKPTITPRFAISCSRKLLQGLGNIARENDLNVQSHISENLFEIEFVKKLFGKSYAKVYADANLLTNKTIMAHAVYLEDEELLAFQKAGASVAHCPASNTLLSSGLCDVKRLLNANIKVGLGTDVSGGSKFSIQDAILRALDVSKHISFMKKNQIKSDGDCADRTVDESYIPLNYKQAIYLATLGGAEALSVGDKVGNFVAGKEFDALVVDIAEYPTKNVPFPSKLSQSKSADCKLCELVEQFVYVGDDRNIVEVYVNGKRIK